MTQLLYFVIKVLHDEMSSAGGAEESAARVVSLLSTILSRQEKSLVEATSQPTGARGKFSPNMLALKKSQTRRRLRGFVGF